MNVLVEYYATLGDKSKHTVRSYKTALNSFVSFFDFSSYKDIDKITSKDIREYIQGLIANGLGNSSANAHLRIIKAYLNFLYSNEYIGGNACDNVKNQKEPKKLPVFLSEEERDAMIAACDDIGLKLMIAMMFYAGLRREEVVNVKLTDINGCHILIHGKGNKERSLILTDFVCDLLNEYLDIRRGNSEYLFVSKRGSHGITAESVRQRVKKVAEIAGIDADRVEKIAPHTLRRTFACLLAENNVGAFAIQKALGHESILTTQRYVAGASNRMVDEALLNQNAPKPRHN